MPRKLIVFFQNMCFLVQNQQERVKAVGLKDDIKEEITVTLEILKHLDKPKPPIVKSE